jgi:hypothetical protein
LIGLEDLASNRVGTFRRRVVVPDLTEKGLHLSSIALAERMDRLTDPPPPGPRAPFVLGTFRVVPKPEAKYLASEPLQLYFQVYGVQTDAVTDQPDLEITYTFHHRTGDRFEVFGRQTIPHAASAAQGFSIPLDDFPLGGYRLEVSVTDLLSGEITVGQVLFDII